MDYDDLDTYNGEVEHDMWVDFDNFENTGQPRVFYDEDIDNFIDKLNNLD